MHGRSLPSAFPRVVVPQIFAAFAILACAAPLAAAPGVPPNFAIDDAVPGAGFSVPTGIAFLPDGRLFVTEKRGRVWEVRNGVKRPNPIWAAENEVLDAGDRGLLGIAVDPNYYVNHYIYFFYVADPDSDGNDSNPFGFDRLTRYQVNFTDSASVIPGSRTILMGYSWPNAPVSCSDSHTVGSLRWGRDGSLMVSVGDGAHYEYMDAGGNDRNAFGSGRTDPYEDIGAFRSQDITSLCGKVLRLNPATGHGYASNPFATSDLGSTRSDGNSVYAARDGQVFTVANSLVDDLSKEADTFRDKRLVRFERSEVSGITASVGSKRRAFSRQQAGWSLDGRAVLAGAADDLMTAILDVESRAFVDDAPLSAFAGRPADVEVEVRVAAGPPWKVSLYPFRGELAAVVSRRPGAFAVGRDVVAKLTGAIEKAGAAPAVTPAATPKR